MTSTLLDRRALLGAGLASAALSATSSSARAQGAGPADTGDFAFEIARSEAEWREMLSDEEYRILREGGTEQKFSSPLVQESREGTYLCKASKLPVYSSEWKVNLDIGYVFFYHSIPNSTLMRIDGVPSRYSDGVDLAPASTIAVHDRLSGSHLGHILIVQGQLLHCINGTSLEFIPETA